MRFLAYLTTLSGTPKNVNTSCVPVDLPRLISPAMAYLLIGLGGMLGLMEFWYTPPYVDTEPAEVRNVSFAV